MTRVFSMRLFVIILSLILGSPARAAVDLDTKYSCVVNETSDTRIPVGTLMTSLGSKDKLVLRSVAQHGHILLQDGGVGIDFYGPLEVYDLYGPKSGAIVLATHFERQLEIQGSISVNEKSRSEIELDILKLDPFIRAFSKSTGAQTFIFSGKPLMIKLGCQVSSS